MEGHWLDDSRSLIFVESSVFQRAWKACALTDVDLFHLQREIGNNPRANPVIKDTGGLRKIRFRPLESSRGKRGSHRICYVFFEEIAAVLLVTAFAKGVASDLSPEMRKLFKSMIEEQKKIIRKRGRL